MPYVIKGLLNSNEEKFISQFYYLEACDNKKLCEISTQYYYLLYLKGTGDMEQQVRSCWTQSYGYTVGALNGDNAAFQPLKYLLKNNQRKTFWHLSIQMVHLDILRAYKKLIDKPGLYPFYRLTNYVKV